MINLVSREDKSLKRQRKIGRWAGWVSTLALILYVGGLVGLAGWWFVMNSEKTQQLVEEQQLLSQLQKLATREILVRQLNARAQVVRQAVRERKALAGLLDKLVAQTDEQVRVVEWTFDVGGGQAFSVEGPSAGSVEVFINKIRSMYSSVKLLKLTRLEGGSWQGRVGVGGGL